MPPFRIPLRRRETVAEQTMVFHFERPAGFQFKAGQTLDFTLIDPPETDAEGNVRTFSIASAPQDADLFVTTRMRGSAFKRVLASAPFGTEVEADGPMGSFTLHHNVAKPAVFLAGGIGITPFRSIVHDAAARKLAQPLWLASIVAQRCRSVPILSMTRTATRHELRRSAPVSQELPPLPRSEW